MKWSATKREFEPAKDRHRVLTNIRLLRNTDGEEKMTSFESFDLHFFFQNGVRRIESNICVNR